MHSASARLLLPALLCCIGAALPAFAVDKKSIDGNEWTQWRGPEMTGASRAKGLIDSWKKEDENLLWKAEVGGRSTPIIMNKKVYMIHESGKQPDWKEQVTCLDADSGKIVWTHRMDLFHTDIPLDRVGWTALAGDPETGNVYANGVQGLVKCFEGATGKVVWEYSTSEQFGRINGYGGRTHTPIVDQDLVILSFLNSSLGDHGKGMHRFLALDKKTGAIRWWSGTGFDALDTNYSCPAVTVIDGVRLLIGGGGDGYVHAFKIATGEKVWSFHLSKGGLNASIVAKGDKIFASHSEDNLDENTLGRIVCINGKGSGDITKTNELWRVNLFEAGYGSPALAGDRLYSIDNGSILNAVDINTGKEAWRVKLGRVAKGSPVVADGKIYYGEVNGGFYIVKDAGEKGEVISELIFPNTPDGLSNFEGCAAIAYGRVYVMNRQALYCLGKKGAKPEKVEVPALPETGPADAKAAWLQLVPAEIHLPHGEKANFVARKFDAKGNLIGEAKAEWKVKGVKGTIGADGALAPDAAVNGQFGVVEATADGLTGAARVRVLPALPLTEDFEKIAEGAAPSYWVGASKVKFQTVIEDGNHILKKEGDNARFRRANVFFGGPSMSGYTIQADVRGAEKRRNMPDYGLINSGYVFDIRGNDEVLRIVGWIPMPRVVKEIPFKAEKDVWYTLKCRVDYKGDKALVRGKVWKQGEAEPKDWTIELEDGAPYKQGSAGLACFSMAEVYYDNVKVTKSE